MSAILELIPQYTHRATPRVRRHVALRQARLRPRRHQARQHPRQQGLPGGEGPMCV